MESITLNATTDTQEKTVESLAIIEGTFTAAAVPITDRESSMYSDFVDSLSKGARAIKDYLEACGIDGNRDLLNRFYGYMEEVRSSLQKVGMM